MRKLVLQGCLAAALLMPAPALAYPQATSPRVEAAIKSSAKSDRELRAFYKWIENRPLWISGHTVGPEADRLIELVATADADGLDPDKYRPRRLIEAVEEARERGSPRDLARAEVLLSRTLAAYVRDVRRAPSLDIHYVDRELVPAPPSARAVLQAAAAAPSLQDYLDGVQWMHPIYAQLREALVAYQHRSFGSPGLTIPSGPSLRFGASGERVRMLRERLGLPQDGAFDASVAAAVQAFQASAGLPDDGVVGPRTLAALNEDHGDREPLLRLNLERARVLPADPERRHIIVDAAGARLWVYEDGRVRDTMKVIVGKPSEQTPMMAGLIRHAMVNPYWNLPPDLVRLRVAAPVLKKGPRYLKAMGFEVLSDWSASPRPVDPATIDWKAVAAGRIELPVRRLPGPDNAMGRMKFMLPNELGIYLHDTPEKELFQKAERRFSSGCIRLEDAQRLAKWMFGRPLVAKSSAPEQQVNLPEPVPVYITYLTAMPTEQGIAFRGDPYNRDRAQLAQLGSRAFGGSP